jgi:hypothetical protein
MNARHLDDDDEVAALLKDVDRREGTNATGGVFKPIAVEPLLQRSLESEQRIKRI